MSSISTFLDQPRLADLARDPLWAPKRAAPEVIDAAIAAAEQAIASSRKSPAERRIEVLAGQAKRYAESVTRGLDSTETQRKNIAQLHLIGALSAALKDATENLGEALDLIENEAREIWSVGQPLEREELHAAWEAEQPKLFQHWAHLTQQAARCF